MLPNNWIFTKECFVLDIILEEVKDYGTTHPLHCHSVDFCLGRKNRHSSGFFKLAINITATLSAFLVSKMVTRNLGGFSFLALG